MGPRLVGRGKDKDILDHIDTLYGFNGAASCGTRKAKYVFGSMAKIVSFNGAASCGTRKGWRFVVTAHDDPASMGPRLVGRGKQIWPSCTRNGTCFNGAASCGTRKGVSPRMTLLLIDSLQWGRVLWDAESRPRRAAPSLSSCFNGAASCGTRKGSTATRTPKSLTSFNGAASCGTRKEERAGRCTSA